MYSFCGSSFLTHKLCVRYMDRFLASATSSSSGSAAQPATAYSSAGRSALGSSSKKARLSSALGSSSAYDDGHSGTSVGYIACPQEVDFMVNRDRRKFLASVKDMIEAGSTIINITFATSVRDALVHIDPILTDLRSTFDELWPSSGAQPAYAFRYRDSMMS